MQIVINAGGKGTRLWPISTPNLPKQFCKILAQKSLLGTTYDRLLQSFQEDNIWISINQKHLGFLKKDLPHFDSNRVLQEPSRRDTFPAVAAHAAVVASQTSSTEPIVFIACDSLIYPQSKIKTQNLTLQKKVEAVLKNQFEIAVIGVKPTFPSPQFGYIHINKTDQGKCFQEAVKVVSFKEKPSLETAKKYLAEGNYFWNFGSFAFTFDSLMSIVQKNLPNCTTPLKNIFEAGKIDAKNYDLLKKTSFDYAVLENAKHLGMVGMEVGWDDIGGFDTLHKYLPKIKSLEEKQQVSKTNPNHIQVDGKNNKAQLQDPDKKVAFVGVSDLILVETEEGILVCDPKKAKEVKKVSGYFE